MPNNSKTIKENASELKNMAEKLKTIVDSLWFELAINFLGMT
jgi:hypothetical protein